MVNYLNILNLWNVVQHDYVSHYDPSNLTLTQNVKELKSQNDYAVSVILIRLVKRLLYYLILPKLLVKCGRPY
jgi:hypothetical protein